MNAMKDSGKTDPPRTGASALRAAQRLRRRRVEKQRYLILTLLCVGLGTAAATSFKPADALATVRQAYQQVRDAYAQARSLLAAEAYARRAAPSRSTPAGMHSPFDSAQAGAHLNTVAAFVGYGPIVLGMGALQERPERQLDLSERAITGRSVPVDAERAWVVVTPSPAPAAWTGRHVHTVPVRKIELAAFEMSATRRTLDAAHMLKSAESEVWTVPLEAYDAFEAALLNKSFGPHPRRPLLPESSELFVLGQEDEASQTPAMEAAAVDDHGTERADPADAPAQDASSGETSTQDAASGVRVSRSQPQAATVPDGKFPVPEPLLTTRAENAPAGEPARAADSAAVEGMRVPPDMPRSAPEQSPERVLPSELETPVSERPEFEQPVPEPVDTPRPDAGSPDAPQPDVERPERTQPDVETPHPEVPAVEHTEIARPDIGSSELGRPDVELSEVSVPAIERPERAPELETPDVTRPETARPEIASPDLELPALEHPDIELPEVPHADLERPQIERPAAERPDTAATDLERPAVVELPEIARPDLERPQLEHPAVERPDISRPGIELPEVLRPDVERPVMERPDLERPDLERPDVERPDLERPGLERPDLERPDLERPDVERPDVERPDVERPDVERPDLERPDLERPDVERPDLERPDIDLPLIERPNL